MTTTIETKVSRKYYDRYFQLKNRPDETKYWCKTENCPQELAELIYEIHHLPDFGCLPNDWIYEQIACSFEYLLDRDFDSVLCELESDIYYKYLDEWLKNPFAQDFCNEALASGIEFDDIYKIIGYGQIRAKERILQAVYEFIQDGMEQADEQIEQ